MAILNRAGFVVPPPVPQTISTHLAPARWARFDFLAYLARRLQWTAGAELGVWEGRTISNVLRANPQLSMIGVDLWEPQPGNCGPEGYEGWDHDQHERLARKACQPFGERAVLVRGWTHEVADRVPPTSLDFVFIDADHGTDAVRRDILAWSPKLKPTGWLIGHDINWPTVRAAVDQLVPGYEIGPDVVWFRPLMPADGWAAEWRA
jgi:hypothetical protein